MGKYCPYFKVVKNVLTDLEDYENDNEKCWTEVKIEVGSKIFIEAGEGDGPIDAFDNALRKRLRAFYPCIDDIKLVDFYTQTHQVKELGTGAIVETIIVIKCGEDDLLIRSKHKNSIRSGRKALMKGYNRCFKRLGVKKLNEIESKAA